MANIYKKINTDLITTTENVAYTVPSNSRALVKSIHIFNEGAGAAALEIKIKDLLVEIFYYIFSHFFSVCKKHQSIVSIKQLIINTSITWRQTSFNKKN